MKKAEKKEEKVLDFKVTRAVQFDDNNVGFDAQLDGISYYNMVFHEGKTKDGKEYSVINFPQRKGKNGKYYNYYWIPIGDKTKAAIVEQLEQLI